MNVLLIAVVLFALMFDFTNGFHDTANAIATSVSTRAISPKIAVIAAAFLNFLGAFVSLQVATTVAKGVVSPGAITLKIVLAGLVAAIIWNLCTWRFGLPTSSSHTLIGGVAGAAIAASGWDVLMWNGLRDKVLLPSLAAPVLGCICAAIAMGVIVWIVRGKSHAGRDRVFRKLQLVSGGFVAFTHGTNDAQKTMGIIALALMAGHANKTFAVPLWVIVASASAMAAGTYLGGWRIINTLGQRLVKLEPQQGFAAEVTTASMLGLSAHFGFPVSTTHTISGSIIGAGVASRQESVRWTVARDIFIAWIVTIPIAAGIGAFMQLISRLPTGDALVIITGLVIASALIVTRHWTWESTAQLRSRLSFLRKIRRRRTPA